jgi:hypothetical protein
MRKLEGMLVVAALVAGCEAEEPETVGPADTVEGCKAVGGRVVVDPGDGTGACGPGEDVVGRPKGFLEGAFCCRPRHFAPTLREQ